MRSLRSLSQEVLKLGEHLLDRVEVGAVERKEQGIVLTAGAKYAVASIGQPSLAKVSRLISKCEPNRIRGRKAGWW